MSARACAESRAASKIDSSMPARRARTMIATSRCRRRVGDDHGGERTGFGRTYEMKKISSATPSRISGIAIGVSTNERQDLRAVTVHRDPRLVPSTVREPGATKRDDQRVDGSGQHLLVLEQLRTIGGEANHSAESLLSLKLKMTTTTSGT